jgi:hypothetical protein
MKTFLKINLVTRYRIRGYIKYKIIEKFFNFN